MREMRGQPAGGRVLRCAVVAKDPVDLTDTTLRKADFVGAHLADVIPQPRQTRPDQHALGTRSTSRAQLTLMSTFGEVTSGQAQFRLHDQPVLAG